MRSKVLHSSKRLYVTACAPGKWARYGSYGSWWFGFDWDPGHVAFPAREARDPSVYVRICGVAVTVWL